MLEYAEATESRMKMKKPTPADHANVLKWLLDQNIECVGSLEEADLQLVKLEKDGIVDGMISEDGDELPPPTPPPARAVSAIHLLRLIHPLSMHKPPDRHVSSTNMSTTPFTPAKSTVQSQ